MHLNTEIKSVCSKFFEDLKSVNDEQNQVYGTILYFIHAASHLSTLFLKWSDLQSLEKFILNTQMNRSLSAATRITYPPVIRAFEYWEMLQDKYGAPGFSSNPVKKKIKKETDKAIVEMLLIMEKVIAQINLKRKLIEEMSAHEDTCSILYGYKWRIICKNINKRNNSRPKRSKLSNSGEVSDEGNSSDLNGCGDASWLTES